MPLQASRSAGSLYIPQLTPLCIAGADVLLCAPQSVKDLPILQDGPPPGGFPAIRIERRLPSTGPTGVTIFAVVVASVAYGHYRVRIHGAFMTVLYCSDTDRG